MKSIFSSIIFALVLTTNCYADALSEISLEEKITQSDIVAVGYISKMSTGTTESGYAGKVAKIYIVKVLKGVPMKTLSVWTDLGISEERLNNFRRHTIYLLFLRKATHGIFASVDGRFGVVPMYNPYTPRNRSLE